MPDSKGSKGEKIQVRISCRTKAKLKLMQGNERLAAMASILRAEKNLDSASMREL
jgi:hypothetical protein